MLKETKAKRFYYRHRERLLAKRRERYYLDKLEGKRDSRGYIISHEEDNTTRVRY